MNEMCLMCFGRNLSLLTFYLFMTSDTVFGHTKQNQQNRTETWDIFAIATTSFYSRPSACWLFHSLKQTKRWTHTEDTHPQVSPFFLHLLFHPLKTTISHTILGGYPPAGYPPQQGYPPAGYPPQPGYPPAGYPPQPGYGAPPPGAYPPGAYPPGAYPPGMHGGHGHPHGYKGKGFKGVSFA